MRETLASNHDLARRMGEAEKRLDKHDGLFGAAFDQFNRLLAARSAPKKPPIGFGAPKPPAEAQRDPDKPASRKPKGRRLAAAGPTGPRFQPPNRCLELPRALR